MRHNSWKKDREVLSEAYGQINEAIPAILGRLAGAAATGAAHAAGGAAVNAITNSGSSEDQEGSNIYERLEEFMETVDDDTVDYLRQILTDFEAIMTDINALEAPDQKIDAVDLGIHLNRLAPFSNM